MKSGIGNRKTFPERSGAEPNGSETWEWEVLPPEARQRHASLEALFRWLALIMDEFLRFPGTKFRSVSIRLSACFPESATQPPQ
jgi:hypothetical protein